MGNDYNITAWWRKKYTVKTRISRWSGLGALSLVGRNILVQSIVYGCLRYWFFSLPTPEEIIVDVEQDVKQLWSAMPELDPNEEGTIKRSRRYMTELASHLPHKQGGGGIMHIRSHVKAFQDQWIVKYLDPRQSPWKDALDHWILPAHPGDDKWATALGRGVLLTPSGIDRAALIPVRSAYIKGCFEAFAELGVQQDTSIADHRIQGEPLCRNHRFTAGNVSYEAEWKLAKDPLATDRLSDLMASSGQPFTGGQWKRFIRACNMPLQWEQDRRQNMTDIRRSVPSDVMDALKQPPPPIQEGEIVYIKHAATDACLRAF